MIAIQKETGKEDRVRRRRGMRCGVCGLIRP
jgi:hypothetical protein